MRELSFFDEKLVGIGKYFPNGETLKNSIKSINFNLLFSHYPRFDSDKGYQFYQTDKKNPSKDKWLLGNKPTKKDEYSFFDTTFIKQIQENYYKQISNLGYQTNLEENKLELKPEWRMNVGLGGESVYETGMTLHHIYGFPYIPATAIKGIAHHYAREEGKDTDLILKIFGSDDTDNPQQGKVIFFDAFPITAPILSPDIMNNHYPKYYDGSGKPPADWQSPIPIFFLTVKETSFKFVVGMKPKEEKANPTLLKTTIDLLKEALSQKGIGAKTAVGYGYMQNK